VSVLAVCTPAQAAVKGVNAHPLLDASKVGWTLDLAKSAGAKMVRADIHWSGIESGGRGNDDPALLGRIDTIVDGLDQRGIRPLLVVMDTPCWASSAPDSLKQGCTGDWGARGVSRYPPTDPRDFGAFMRVLAARYRGRADYEIWNEPNLTAYWTGTPEDYVRLVKEARSGVRAADPHAKVVAGGVVPQGTTLTDQQFVDRMYRAGLKGNLDGLSLHPYNQPALSPLANPSPFYSGVPAVRAIEKRYGDASPIWLTEFGWPTCTPGGWGCVTPAQQAQFVKDAYALVAQRSYVAAALLYQLVDNAYDPAAFEQNFGLFAFDGTAKPALAAFRAAV
jgi:hypothetical protein